MPEDEFERCPAEEQVYGVEPFEAPSCPGAAVDGQPKLLERAGFGVGELTRAADASGKRFHLRGPPKKPGFLRKDF